MPLNRWDNATFSIAPFKAWIKSVGDQLPADWYNHTVAAKAEGKGSPYQVFKPTPSASIPFMARCHLLGGSACSN